MTQEQTLNEYTLTADALKRLSDPEGVLYRAAHMLEFISVHSVGLGEVLQDYAAQGHSQLCDLIRAASNVTQGAGHEEDKETLVQVHFILKNVKAVLEMTPAAMTRNKALILGEKEKISRADIAEMCHAFTHSADIVRLLSNEDSGSYLAGLVQISDIQPGLGAPEQHYQAGRVSH